MGVVVSALVTENEQLDILLALFVAVHPTYTVSRLLKLIGLVTLHDWLRIPKISDAVGNVNEMEFDNEAPLEDDEILLTGQLMTGLRASRTANTSKPLFIVDPEN